MIVAYKKSELSHHGILGMHWGERNGPPYPLGAGDHSASEKKAGWKKSLRSSGKPQEKRKVKSPQPKSMLGKSGAQQSNEGYSNFWNVDYEKEEKKFRDYKTEDLDDFWDTKERKAKSGGIGDRGAGDILSKRDEAKAEKVMNNIERNVQEIVNEIIGGKNNPKYPNREAMADKAAALRRQGLTNEQIAKKLGYESPSEISALLKDKNVKPKQMSNEIANMTLKGATDEEIAKKLGSYKSGSSVNMFTQKDNKQASAEADKPIDRGELARKQLNDLLDKGYTYDEIIKALGVNSPSDLVNVVPKLSPVSDKTLKRKYNIDRGNVSVRDAKMNRHNYTTSDIYAIVNRYNADKSLKDIISAEDKAKRERALKFIKGVTEVSKTLYDASNEVDKWYKKFNGG